MIGEYVCCGVISPSAVNEVPKVGPRRERGEKDWVARTSPGAILAPVPFDDSESTLT